MNMASPRSRYTLLIPTFNRPAYLRSLLGYLAARRFQYPVHVLDSSSGDALSQNRETVGRGGLDIVHRLYDPATHVHKKIELAMRAVESTYCSLCADDDVLFTDELTGLFDVLDANPALVIAHGYYVNFKSSEDFDIWYTDYSAPSIVAEDALKRIVEQMSNYQAIFYGVHRTATMKLIQQPLDRVKSLWAKELLTSSLALIDGGMYRMPRYYMARNTNPSIATEGWHPHQFFAIEPAQLLREYADYRTVTLEHLAADARCRAAYRPEQMQRVFDLVHLKYLAPMLSPGVMNYLIQQSLRSDITPRQMIDGMWSTFVPPYARRAGGLKDHFAHALALVLRPSYATAALEHLRRIVGLYVELRLRKKLDVSLGSSFDRLTITRRTRDGRARKYLASHTLLDQKFADGGQVTASHLRNIINHLDDYV
jgi:glycosyltransferase domain-containing protein